MTNEQDLIKNCLKGNSRALAAFYDLYAPKLLGASMRYVSLQADAEDILQEAFIKILQNLNRFEYRGEGSLEGWMRKIVVNLSLNFIKKREKDFINTNIELPVVADESGTFDPPTQIAPEEVLRLINELPIGYRTVLNLYVFEKYSHREISEMLQCSESNSKSQLLRARALLKKNLMQRMNELEKIPTYGK
jgi:RNA polymerase sigma-70 factor (ECF subfamily)